MRVPLKKLTSESFSASPSVEEPIGILLIRKRRGGEEHRISLKTLLCTQFDFGESLDKSHFTSRGMRQQSKSSADPRTGCTVNNLLSEAVRKSDRPVFICERQKVCLVTLQVLFFCFFKEASLSSQNAFVGLLPRWIDEINYIDLGNVPSDASGYCLPGLYIFFFFLQI